MNAIIAKSHWLFRSTSSGLVSMLPLHYNDLGFLCRELNSGLDLERVISYHWTTQEGCSLRALYHRVVSINRPSGYEPDALPLRHDDGLS